MCKTVKVLKALNILCFLPFNTGQRGCVYVGPRARFLCHQYVFREQSWALWVSGSGSDASHSRCTHLVHCRIPSWVSLSCQASSWPYEPRGTRLRLDRTLTDFYLLSKCLWADLVWEANFGRMTAKYKGSPGTVLRTHECSET